MLDMTVVEMPRRLEAVTPDTFISGLGAGVVERPAGVPGGGPRTGRLFRSAWPSAAAS